VAATRSAAVGQTRAKMIPRAQGDTRVLVLGLVALLAVSILFGWIASSLPPPLPRLRPGQIDASRPAARVLSVDYRSDEIVLSLIRSERILGLSLDADNPEMSNTVALAAAVPRRLDLNVEQILSLEPDVVVVGKVGLDDPLSLLETAGIRVVRLNSANTLAEIQENITAIGKGIGESRAAAGLVAEMDWRLGALRHVTGRLPHPRTLYVYIGGASTETAGDGTYIDELLNVAGAINVAREAGVRGWGSLPVEKAIEMNPEVIIYADSRERDKAIDAVAAPGLADNPVWKDILAVKTGRVYRVSGRYLYCSTHFTAGTAEVIAAILHPELRAVTGKAPYR